MQQPLLSICVPTYNRGRFLKGCLDRIIGQIQKLPDPTKVELFISNNASPDNTDEIIQGAMKSGVPITYNKNETNIGADRNFLICFKQATGKYVWLIGDDDYIVDGSIERILNILEGPEIGMIHLKPPFASPKGIVSYENVYDFIGEASIFLTFITASVINRSFVEQVNLEKYIGSYFLHLPLVLTAALGSNRNVVVHAQTYEGSRDWANNGGYNYFRVFGVNYPKILKQFLYSTPEGRLTYEKEKKSMYQNHIHGHAFKFLVLRQDKGNYDITGGWSILLRNFGLKRYFYTAMVASILHESKKRLKRIFK